MTRRRSGLGLARDMDRLARSVGQAWSAADVIQRRYPRLFAAKLADALDLNEEAGRSFIDLVEREFYGIENTKRD